MLVLSRKPNESVVINDHIVVTVVEVRGDKVRLGIQAPRDVSIHRSEVLAAIQRAQAEAMTESDNQDCEPRGDNAESGT
jgi:carbon storage regulator